VRVADVARRHGISRSLLYTWCRELARADLLDLVPVVVEAPDGSMASAAPARRGITRENATREPDGSIEIALTGDVRVTVRGRVDPKGCEPCWRRYVRHDRAAERGAGSDCDAARRLPQRHGWPRDAGAGALGRRSVLRDDLRVPGPSVPTE
jgi:transposase-like protein